MIYNEQKNLLLGPAEVVVSFGMEDTDHDVQLQQESPREALALRNTVTPPGACGDFLLGRIIDDDSDA